MAGRFLDQRDGLPRRLGNAVPDRQQLQFLQALLCSDLAEGIIALQAWARTNASDTFDLGLERLLPIVYQRTTGDAALRLGIPSGPMSQDALAKLHRRTARSNLTCLHNGFRLLDLLDAAAVPFLVLKGAALTALIYESDWGARPFEDLDILIGRDDIDQAIAITRNAGYKSYDDVHFRHDSIAPHCAASYVDDSRSHVDIHWRLTEWQQDPGFEQRAFARSVQVSLAGRVVATLDRTDHLFHALFHGLSPNVVPPIRWVVDATHLIRSGEIDWHRLVAESKNARAGHQTSVGISWLSEHIDVDIPDTVVPLLRLNLSLTERALELGINNRALRAAVSVVIRYIARTRGRSLALRVLNFPLFAWNWAHLDGRTLRVRDR